MKRLMLFIVLALSFTVFADDLTIVAVGDAEQEVDKLVVLNIFIDKNYSAEEKNLIKNFRLLINNDFGFYKKLFNVIKAPKKKFTNLTVSTKARYVIEFTMDAKVGDISFKAILFDKLTNKKMDEQTGRFHRNNVRQVGHSLANKLYQTITNKKSIFMSQIVFVSDRTSGPGKVVKELYIMDFDGKNVRRLTGHRGIVISPSISHDGKKILYGLIKYDGKRKKRNHDLYLYDVIKKQTKIISSRRGINSGAVFFPDDKSILLTLSHTGNTEIFKMNLKTKKLKRITRHYSHDVDPSISSDGNLMSFLSSRPGKAMIYTLDPSGVEKRVKRISFVGNFNATPRFSPDGKDIVFSSWLDNCFDIFRIGHDGNELIRLTKNFGSNEDPTFSPDGQFIAFSSQRVFSKKRAIQNIYIMDRDGEVLGQITSRFGNCLSPRWSK